MKTDLSRSFSSLIDGAVARARRCQMSERWDAAAEAWEEAASHASKYSEYARSADEKKQRMNTAAEFRAVAQRIRQMNSPIQPPVGSLSPATEIAELPTENELQQAVRQLIHRSEVTFQDIAGMQETASAIQAAFALSQIRAPQGVQLPPVKNVLFYGPPGCGKTLLAAAASNGLDATFFNVKVGDLMSKYFGESCKLVQALYDEAREKSPSVVFLDEVDALAADRQGADSGTERRVLVSLLSELDGLAQKYSDRFVLTIAATNAPWLLDEAILSRFERKVYIPLPTPEARQQILERQLAGKGYLLEVQVESLVERTGNFSGRELERLTKLLIEQMIMDMNPDLTAVAVRGRRALEDYVVRLRPISNDDLQVALTKVKAETPPELIRRYERWAN